MELSFIEETKDKLTHVNSPVAYYSLFDCIGYIRVSGKGEIDWDTLSMVSNNIVYESGYGIQTWDGYIVFEDGTWLGREEYDGSEWWRYNKAPDEPDIPEGKTIVIEDYQCPDDEDDEEVDNESGGNKSDLS